MWICVLEVLCLAEVETSKACNVGSQLSADTSCMEIIPVCNLVIFTHNAYIVTLVDLKT